MKVGDKIVWTPTYDGSAKLRSGVITRIKGDTCWVDHQHKPEDSLYLEYAWPSEYQRELEEILARRGALKRAYDDSRAEVYELRMRIDTDNGGSR